MEEVIDKTQKFVDRANKLHNGRYDYSKAVYVKASVDVEIVCHLHGSFMQTPNKHLSGRGCRTCSSISRSKSQTLTTPEFVAKGNAKHNHKYDYSCTDYVSAKTKVEIICPIHGSFFQTPDVHLRSGCNACGNVLIGKALVDTATDFIRKANITHEHKYTYERVEYKNSLSKVEVTCPEHGPFTTAPNNHIAGRGCPSCAKTGYNKGKSGSIYIMQCDNIVKVGITNRSVSIRLRELRKSSGKDFSLVYTQLFESGVVPRDIETILLANLRSECRNIEDKFSGSTECFYHSDIPSFMELVNKTVVEAVYEH